MATRNDIEFWLKLDVAMSSFYWKSGEVKYYRPEVKSLMKTHLALAGVTIHVPNRVPKSNRYEQYRLEMNQKMKSGQISDEEALAGYMRIWDDEHKSV